MNGLSARCSIFNVSNKWCTQLDRRNEGVSNWIRLHVSCLCNRQPRPHRVHCTRKFYNLLCSQMHTKQEAEKRVKFSRPKIIIYFSYFVRFVRCEKCGCLGIFKWITSIWNVPTFQLAPTHHRHHCPNTKWISHKFYSIFFRCCSLSLRASLLWHVLATISTRDSINWNGNVDKSAAANIFSRIANYLLMFYFRSHSFHSSFFICPTLL